MSRFPPILAVWKAGLRSFCVYPEVWQSGNLIAIFWPQNILKLPVSVSKKNTEAKHNIACKREQTD